MSVRKVFMDLLRFFDGKLDAVLQEVSDNFSFPLLFSLIAVSFIYGFIHSAGPGHGKTLVTSIFIKEKHPLIKALLISAVVALVHTGSAVILAFTFSFVLRGIQGIFHIKLQGFFFLASGILILVIGLVFLLLKILHKDHHHAHDDERGHNRNIFIVGVTAGIVPCPASLMIMLLAISKRAVVVGLIAVLSIALGIFTLLTIVGLIAISVRKGILSTAKNRTNRGAIVSKVLEYTAISFIIIVGSTIILRFVL
jgi:nickel/cobalt transporter (NicO) family protein